jgi:outer membrane biogenesis lipoprotein LolB
MRRRLVVALAALLLAACTGSPNKKPAVDDIERRHAEDIQRMG